MPRNRNNSHAATAAASPADLGAPAELVSFVRRQVTNSTIYGGGERRAEERESLVVPVLVQPVDKSLRPVGDPFTAVTRDISRSGIGLVYFERVPHCLLAIQARIAGEDVKLVVEIVWQESMGPFEYIGCVAVARLRAFPGQNSPSR